jgi:signal transduction histidine kinase
MPLARLGAAIGSWLRRVFTVIGRPWKPVLHRLSLSARITIVATLLFSFAVASASIFVILLSRYALTHVMDSSADKSASDIADQFVAGHGSSTVTPTSGGVLYVQVVDGQGHVIAASPGADAAVPVIDPNQTAQVRNGSRLTIDAPPPAKGRWRVVGRAADGETVLVVTDFSRVDDSQTVLRRAAAIGGPIAVLLMALATYTVVRLTLRPVANLRHGAADITAAGLADQRLPVPDARDEIHNLAVTLNDMLDRIDAATARQRTFVGDAAHELRSPLASLRVQIEVAQRQVRNVRHAPIDSAEWNDMLADVMIDVQRLDRLVDDLLALARIDESGGILRREDPVRLDDLAVEVVGGYADARVPVEVLTPRAVTVLGDPDGLRRVIINLVDNAVRHAGSSVTVAVTTEMIASRTVAQLTVSDDGPGLPAEERERVFDRFYRLEESRDRESGGTGLGLPIVRDVVRTHHGSVRLTDRLDGRSGLRALVILPLS